MRRWVRLVRQDTRSYVLDIFACPASRHLASQEDAQDIKQVITYRPVGLLLDSLPSSLPSAMSMIQIGNLAYDGSLLFEFTVGSPERELQSYVCLRYQWIEVNHELDTSTHGTIPELWNDKGLG